MKILTCVVVLALPTAVAAQNDAWEVHELVLGALEAGGFAPRINNKGDVLFGATDSSNNFMVLKYDAGNQSTAASITAWNEAMAMIAALGNDFYLANPVIDEDGNVAFSVMRSGDQIFGLILVEDDTATWVALERDVAQPLGIDPQTMPFAIRGFTPRLNNGILVYEDDNQFDTLLRAGGASPALIAGQWTPQTGPTGFVQLAGDSERLIALASPGLYDFNSSGTAVFVGDVRCPNGCGPLMVTDGPIYYSDGSESATPAVTQEEWDAKLPGLSPLSITSLDMEPQGEAFGFIVGDKVAVVDRGTLDVIATTGEPTPDGTRNFGRFDFFHMENGTYGGFHSIVDADPASGRILGVFQNANGRPLQAVFDVGHCTADSTQYNVTGPPTSGDYNDFCNFQRVYLEYSTGIAVTSAGALTEYLLIDTYRDEQGITEEVARTGYVDPATGVEVGALSSNAWQGGFLGLSEGRPTFVQDWLGGLYLLRERPNANDGGGESKPKSCAVVPPAGDGWLALLVLMGAATALVRRRRSRLRRG